jgi:hypothetical protein
MNWTKQVERWDVFELETDGPAHGNPFKEVSLTAEFDNAGRAFRADGFYDGDGRYKVRFCPNLPGEWVFRTTSDTPALDGLSGTFSCLEAGADNHGPVRVANTHHFAYEDGTPHRSFGTTCYAWVHQGETLEQQTLETLSHAPFNKMRMCVFPKHYDFNHNEPAQLPFAGSLERGIDFTRFNPAFFRHLERRILDLRALGIEADLILFHPYDRWGFADMDAETDDFYLRYVVARLSAYRNVWWSLANEYDLMRGKTIADWERFARILMDHDPVGHLRSIHNCVPFYDHTRPWVTHCSVQRVDVHKTAEAVTEWRERWGKPVVVDECAYEGNINHGWGNIPGPRDAAPLLGRACARRVHGSWRNLPQSRRNPVVVQGGKLVGSSPERIAFLRRIAEEGPVQGLSPYPTITASTGMSPLAAWRGSTTCIVSASSSRRSGSSG